MANEHLTPPPRPKRVRVRNKSGRQATYYCSERSRRVVLNYQAQHGLPSASAAFEALMEHVCTLDPALVPPRL